MTNEQLALRWARMTQGQQPEKSLQGSHMFISGAVIYSYGHHYPIAKYHPKHQVYLINSRGYSNTTSIHTSHVRNALASVAPQIKVISVPDIGLGHGHQTNLKELKHIYTSSLKRLSHLKVTGTSQESLKWRLLQHVCAYKKWRYYLLTFSLPTACLPNLQHDMQPAMARIHALRRGLHQPRYQRLFAGSVGLPQEVRLAA